MKLIDKYLYREYFHALTYCLLTFISLFIISDLLGHLSKYLSANTPKYIILKFYILNLTVTLEYILPACMMLATLYTLWQLSRHNELIAMRASGISLLSIMKPFLIVGICISIGMTAVKEYITPYASVWVEKLSECKYNIEKFNNIMDSSIQDFPYANTDTHRQWRIAEFNTKHPEKISGVTLIREKDDGTRIEKITADKAEWLDGQWWFHNVTIQKFDDKDNPAGKPFSPIPGENTVMEMPGLSEKPHDFINSAQSPEFMSASSLRRYLKTHKFLPASEKIRLRVDFHSRLAMPWACLIATIFAIPVGAKSSRQSVLINIFTAIAYLLLFYAVIQFGLILGKKQVLSPWLGAWLSNIVFFIAGLIMTKKII